MRFYGNLVFGMLAIAAGAPSPALAYPLTFTNADFTLTPVFNSITSFSFTIDIDAALAPGSYVNPTLNSVQYSVQGVLGGTPSGFPRSTWCAPSPAPISMRREARCRL